MELRPDLAEAHFNLGMVERAAGRVRGAIECFGRALAPNRSRVISVFAERRVSSDRIEFVGRMTRQEYFDAHDRIDVCLDTLSYNGGTTTLDAYSMGVPVVTKPGDLAFRRAAHAISHHLGFPELSCRTDEEETPAARQSRTFGSGVVALHYEPQRSAPARPLVACHGGSPVLFGVGEAPWDVVALADATPSDRTDSWRDSSP